MSGYHETSLPGGFVMALGLNRRHPPGQPGPQPTWCPSAESTWELPLKQFYYIQWFQSRWPQTPNLCPFDQHVGQKNATFSTTYVGPTSLVD